MSEIKKAMKAVSYGPFLLIKQFHSNIEHYSSLRIFCLLLVRIVSESHGCPGAFFSSS